jgi:rubrerythrin
MNCTHPTGEPEHRPAGTEGRRDMDSEGTLEKIEVDADGALRENAAVAEETLEKEGDTRLDFFKKAGIAGGGVIGGGALLSALVPGVGMATERNHHHNGGGLDRPPKKFGKGDVGILNYALTLEYLEASFYNEAAKKGKFDDKATRDFLAAVVRDENAHVRILEGILGRKAVKKPKFDFGMTTSDEKLFVATSFALENTGVGAYSGQAFNIKHRRVLAGALSIVTVEARHAGLIGQIYKGRKGVAPDGPTDDPVGARETLKAVKQTGFITG